MWRVGDVCYCTFKTLRFSLLSRPCQAQTATESQQRPLGSVLSGNSILLAANREEEGGSVNESWRDVYGAAREVRTLWLSGEAVKAGLTRQNWDLYSVEGCDGMDGGSWRLSMIACLLDMEKSPMCTVKNKGWCHKWTILGSPKNLSK